MAVEVLWPKPYKKKISEVNRRGEVPTWTRESEGSGEVLLEEWSLIYCQVISNLIRLTEEDSTIICWKMEVAKIIE